MFIIGVTGPSGAGKGAASEYLNTRYGYKVIDADRVYHDIISAPSDCVSELVEHFGKGVLNEQGGIDRKALSKLVFGEENKEKLLLLNKITHKYVVEEIDTLLKSFEREGAEVCVIDAPLLIEAGVNKLCDRVLVVYANKEVRAERIAKRDGIDLESAMLRINSQKPYEFYSENCDFFITNHLRLEELGLFIDSFLRCEGLIK